MTPRMIRCVAGFIVPFLFMSVILAWYLKTVVWHAGNWSTDHYRADVVGPVLGLEILWAYFPLMSNFAWWCDHGRRCRIAHRLRYEVFFWWPGWMLAAVTATKWFLVAYADPSESERIRWGLQRTMEVLWVEYPLAGALFWMYDHWRKSESMHRRLCVIGFLVPGFALAGTVFTHAMLEVRGRSLHDPSMICLDAVSTVLFVWMPGVGIYSWLIRHWHTECAMAEKQRHTVLRPDEHEPHENEGDHDHNR